jgi:hypothetical protein
MASQFGAQAWLMNLAVAGAATVDDPSIGEAKHEGVASLGSLTGGRTGHFARVLAMSRLPAPMGSSAKSPLPCTDERRAVMRHSGIVWFSFRNVCRSSSFPPRCEANRCRRWYSTSHVVWLATVSRVHMPAQFRPNPVRRRMGGWAHTLWETQRCLFESLTGGRRDACPVAAVGIVPRTARDRIRLTE